MPKNMTIGVRLPGDNRQWVAEQASILRIPQSALIRVLVNLAIEQVENDPSILLKRSLNASS